MRLAALLLLTPTLSAQTPTPKPPLVLPNGHLRVSSGEMAGRLIYRPDPIIADECRAGRSCVAMVHVVVGKTGDVEDVTPIGGNPLLLPIVMKTIKTWRYKPYLLDGEPRVVEITVTVDYLMGGSSSPPSPSK